VLLIPPTEIATEKARAILPKMIPHADAVKSAGNAAAIAAAFASGNYRALRGNFGDQLHQPYRSKLVRCVQDSIAAAEKTGALGAFLSGSGSAICAVTLSDPRKIGAAMLGASRSEDARIVITSTDNRGVRVVQSPIANRKSQIQR
jgi:homoserine kinase